MYKFQDTELKFDKRLRDSLAGIYGVGFQKASYICDLLGLGLSFNINLLNNYFYELIVIIFKYHYILEERLRNIINQRLNFFFEIRLIVGIRLSKGLPVRGQRTHTNRQNARNLKPLLIKKEETIVYEVSKTKGKNAFKTKGKNASKTKGKNASKTKGKNVSKTKKKKKG